MLLISSWQWFGLRTRGWFRSRRTRFRSRCKMTRFQTQKRSLQYVDIRCSVVDWWSELNLEHFQEIATYSTGWIAVNSEPIEFSLIVVSEGLSHDSSCIADHHEVQEDVGQQRATSQVIWSSRVCWATGEIVGLYDFWDMNGIQSPQRQFRCRIADCDFGCHCREKRTRRPVVRKVVSHRNRRVDWETFGCGDWWVIREYYAIDYWRHSFRSCQKCSSSTIRTFQPNPRDIGESSS